jgi:hypothetical protein
LRWWIFTSLSLFYQRGRGRKKLRIARLRQLGQRWSGSTGVPQCLHGGFWATIPPKAIARR